MDGMSKVEYETKHAYFLKDAVYEIVVPKYVQIKDYVIIIFCYDKKALFYFRSNANRLKKILRKFGRFYCSLGSGGIMQFDILQKASTKQDERIKIQSQRSINYVN